MNASAVTFSQFDIIEIIKLTVAIVRKLKLQNNRTKLQIMTV